MPTVSCVVLPAHNERMELDDFNLRLGYPQEGETLPFLQESVGGTVECFDVEHPVTGAVATVWFHGEGKIIDLPRNKFAEIVSIVGGWMGPLWGEWIAGPVVMTGFDRESGETRTLPDEWGVTIAEVAEAYRLALQSIAAGSTD